MNTHQKMFIYCFLSRTPLFVDTQTLYVFLSLITVFFSCNYVWKTQFDILNKYEEDTSIESVSYLIPEDTCVQNALFIRGLVTTILC